MVLRRSFSCASRVSSGVRLQSMAARFNSSRSRSNMICASFAVTSVSMRCLYMLIQFGHHELWLYLLNVVFLINVPVLVHLSATVQLLTLVSQVLLTALPINGVAFPLKYVIFQYFDHSLLWVYQVDSLPSTIACIHIMQDLFVLDMPALPRQAHNWSASIRSRAVPLFILLIA